jgi:hypothetical protein
MIAHSSNLLPIETLQVSKHSTAVEEGLEYEEALGLNLETIDEGEIGLTIRSEFNFLMSELLREERGIQTLIIKNVWSKLKSIIKIIINHFK